MENNGSLQPIIKTDEENTYFMVTLPINQEYIAYIGNQVSDFIINSLDDLIILSNAVDNAVSNGVSNQANDILNNQIHRRV